VTNREQRIISGAVELRARASGEGQEITGLGVVFGQKSVNLGGFRELIDPAAFDSPGVLDDVRIMGTFEHRDTIGRLGAGTLRITKETAGLRYAIDPPSWASGLVESIQRGDITGSSFGFTLNPDGDDWFLDEDGFVLRMVVPRGVSRLWDEGPVSSPAYEQTAAGDAAVGLRSLARRASKPLDLVSRLAGEGRLGELLEKSTNDGRVCEARGRAIALLAMSH
jgi:HK97 family phage prohead protease